MRLTLLGTGTSFGVPQIGCRCPACTSTDPRDRRGRTSALIETRDKRLLIDTPPELRLQLVGAGVDHVDAVLFTHGHADHVHGIDDLRALSVRLGAMLPAYGSRETMAELAAKFPYIFDPAIVVPVGTTKPELVAHALEPGVTATIAGVAVLPLALPHGQHVVLGYRVGPVAYLTDVKVVPETVV
ncbi:MAG TPA: MBL fold metallo-hydrolase, partial [Gemmatimonadales bacterium]|nr:MBL fold metallo-hydrolase [Gemmatimonadales bacterium]